MNKKWLLFVILSSVIILLSSCVKGDFHVTVNRDQSAELDYKLALSSQLIGLMSMNSANKTDMLGELKKNFETDGYQVSQYKDGDYQGVQAKKHVKDVKEIKNVGVNQGSINAENKIDMTVDKGFIFNTHHLIGNFDLSSMKADAKDTMGLQKMMISQIDLKFTLTLPDKAEQQNASRVLDDGKTYQWDLLAGANNEVNLDIKAPNTVNVSILVAVVVILIAAIIFLLLRRKKRAQPAEPLAIETPIE
ncbi:DUF3153 domain-containing protein [Paenibacillus sp. FSL H7-0331]|uniref:LppM family (lipo)protein n=1 Tax=Paenibacillus sp. FSL H7-0331 TaxID=1920421 RepID=UPI00096D07BE|nr:DUF3153 domain-containing protein [Paenibacillus sp. FSL H7-0331]OMF19434.1 hypothetical protein BK127_05625 [Paenibacillus sp. FSL H7-0331]